MPVLLYCVNRSDLAPFRMPDRFRQEITFFMTSPGESGVPQLAAGEYWIRLSDAKSFLDEGCLRIVSPLDETQFN